MNEQEGANSIYNVHCNGHAKQMSNMFSSFLEDKSFVDVLIHCGGESIHVHKCVLAANSPYFKKQFQKQPETEQIIIHGFEFVIIKTIIEFMYCGKTNVSKQNLKYVLAAAKYFQMRGLKPLVSNNEEILWEAAQIVMEPPTFLAPTPKYTDMPLVVGPGSSKADPQSAKKMRSKYVKSKNAKPEAAASSSTTATQTSLFVIKDCTVTTTNIITPHTETSMDTSTLNLMEGVPLQVGNYHQLSNDQILTVSQIPQEQLKVIFPVNVPLMYRTVDGNLAEPLGEENPMFVQPASSMQQCLSLRGSVPPDILNLPLVTDDTVQSVGNENMDYQSIQTSNPSAQVNTEYLLNEGIINVESQNEVFNIENFYNDANVNPAAVNDFPNVSSSSADPSIMEDDVPDETSM